jgi:hypothetical protein
MAADGGWSLLPKSMDCEGSRADNPGHAKPQYFDSIDFGGPRYRDGRTCARDGAAAVRQLSQCRRRTADRLRNVFWRCARRSAFSPA